ARGFACCPIAAHIGAPCGRAGSSALPRKIASRTVADLLLLQKNSRRQQLLAPGRKLRFRPCRRSLQPQRLSRMHQQVQKRHGADGGGFKEMTRKSNPAAACLWYRAPAN